MKIFINSEAQKIESTNVGDALSELGFEQKSVAAALNGRFIPRELRAATALSDGDRLEVLAPMQGG